MNTAFLDAQNLAWKIHAVEGGFARPELLETYEPERRNMAEKLLDFDNRYAKLFSQRIPAAEEVRAASDNHGTEAAQHDNDFVKMFKESCSFTSGYGVYYEPNALNWSPSHPARSPLIRRSRHARLETGHLFVNSDVTRVTDANVVHLEQEVPLNGSFRIFVFAGKPWRTEAALRDLAAGIASRSSFYTSYLRNDVDRVSRHEKHNPHSQFFTVCTVFSTRRPSIEISRDVPGILGRYREHVYADDLHDDQVPDSDAPSHAKMGFSPETGGVVVVRPDGYVGIVVDLVEGTGTVDALNQYFSAFCTKPLGGRISTVRPMGRIEARL